MRRWPVAGGQQALTRSYGQQAYASGQFANQGDAQGSLYISRIKTTDNNLTELFLDGIGPNGQRMNVPQNGTWTFQILITARDNGFVPETLVYRAGSAASGVARGLVEWALKAGAECLEVSEAVLE